MNIRHPAVAGLFYEGDTERLREQVDELLAAANPQPGPPPRGLIAPHAGYIYSGELAASAYRQLRTTNGGAQRVVLLGPAHRVYLQGMALPGAEAFATPLGKVSLDRATMAQLAALPGVCTDDEAHREEHSLEVHLPFLQAVLGDFGLVPVVVGDCPPAQVAQLIDTLWAEPDTLLVASTDLSHFLPYDRARRRDTATCERIVAGDDKLSGEDACGARVLNGLQQSRLRREVELLGMCNSGDTAGNRDRVVGYGAFLLH